MADTSTNNQIDKKAQDESTLQPQGKDTSKDGGKDKAAKMPEVKAKAKSKSAAKTSPKPKKVHAGLSTGVWIAIAIVCAVAGGLVGHFAFGGTVGSSTLAGKTTVSEGELDTVMGSFTYNGATTNVTVRDVITTTSSLDSAKQDDGTYSIPSADGVLSFARSKIVEQEAQKRGLTVSDDDMSSYAESTLGSSDYANIASQYGMSEDAVKKLVQQSALTKKLRDQVVTTQTIDQPTAPTQPADDATDTPTAEYAQYIINLAGDEWDAQNNTWKSTDGTYASALQDYTITNDSATYAAAQAAYYVAYQQYSTNATQVSNEWTNFVNGLLDNAQITISTLVA